MKKTALFLLVAVLMTAGISQAATSHEVKPGETLAVIAEFYYGDPAYAFALAEANTVPDPQHLRAGQWLKVPTLTEIVRARAAKPQTVAQTSFSQTLTGPAQAAPLCNETKVAEAPAPAPQYRVTGEVRQFSGELMKSDNYQVGPTPAVPQPSLEIPAQTQETQVAVVAAPVLPPPAKAAAPPKKSDEKNDNFVELNASAGYWQNVKHDTEGFWAESELLYWLGLGEKNLGLGPMVKYDQGHSKVNPDVDWGYTAPGVELGGWLTLSDTDYLLVKPRLTYRMHKSGSDKKDGWMPGYYLEYTHVLGGRDSVLLASGGWFFENDNYLDARLYWDHKYSRNVELKAGIGPVFHWGNDWDYTSASPTLSLKWRDTLTLGVTAEFSEEGPAYGAFLMYEFNTAK